MTSRRARFVLQIYWSKGLYRPRMYLIQDEIIRRVKDVPVHHHPTHFCLACYSAGGCASDDADEPGRVPAAGAAANTTSGSS
jgi:hypothetical protein